MTEQHSQERVPSGPAGGGAARQQSQAEGERRGRTLGYLAVAAACLILGGAAVYFALRAGWISTGTTAPQATHGAAAAPEAAPSSGGMAGMPGMEGPAAPA